MNGESLFEQLDIDGVGNVIARANSGELDNDPRVIELRHQFVANEVASQPDHIHYPTNIRQRIAIRGISRAKSTP